MTDEQRSETPRRVDPRRGSLETLDAEVEQNGRIACPVCGFPIGAVRGSKSAICGNCGFKDGCC